MTARIGSAKTGGRRRGSLDKGERQVVTSEMAGDILAVYKKLGGAKWLLKFAEDNPAEFLRQGLSRLFPAAPKDEEAGSTYNQFNFDTSDTFECARRVAFALNMGVHAQRELAPVAERVPDAAPVMTPQQACDWREPLGREPLLQPEPLENPDQIRWAAELPLSPQERAENMIVRETKELRIENYPGGGAEQGRGPIQRPAASKSSAGDLCKRLSRRGKELL